MTYKFTAEQLAAIAGVQAAFPEIDDPRELVEGPLAQWALGDLPPWSNLARHQLTGAQTANVGAAVMCLYLDGPHREPWIYLGQRPHPKLAGLSLYNGSGGGFGNLRLTDRERARLADDFSIITKAAGEQPPESAAREWAEENRTPDNKPLFLLKPADLKLIDINEGIDYSATTPTAYSMFYTFLSAAQKQIVKAHAAGMEDEAYRAACMQHSGNETSRARLLPLMDAAAINFDEFAYPHELKAIRRLNAMHQGGELRWPVV